MNNGQKKRKPGFLLLPKLQGQEMVKKSSFRKILFFFLSLGQSVSSVCLLPPSGTRHKLEAGIKTPLDMKRQCVWIGRPAFLSSKG